VASEAAAAPETAVTRSEAAAVEPGAGLAAVHTAVVAEAFSLSTAEIEQIVLNGVEAAFTDDETKRTLARRVRSAFAPLG